MRERSAIFLFSVQRAHQPGHSSSHRPTTRISRNAGPVFAFFALPSSGTGDAGAAVPAGIGSVVIKTMRSVLRSSVHVLARAFVCTVWVTAKLEGECSLMIVSV